MVDFRIGKISVIIPCYNCEKTVNRALKSLENQTYRNFEVIAIDDGSTDSTLKLINEYKSQGRMDLKVYHQDNSGVSVARNKGIELAQGEYIVFLDSDDAVSIDFLQLLVGPMNDNTVDVVYGFLSRNYEDLSTKAPRSDAPCESIKKSQSDIAKVLIHEKYRLGFFTYIYRLSILNRHNIRFTTGLKTGEDLEFLWTYIAYCKNGVEINKYIYWYYDNPKSAVSKVDWYRTDSLNSLTRVYTMMKDNNCDFADFFYSYMTSRYLWSYAKTFSVGRRKDLFDKLNSEYDLRSAMKYLINECNDKRVKLTALLYLFNRELFFYLVGFIGRK